MDLLLVLFNAFLYIVLLRWYWKKHKTHDAGFLLIAVWATIAVFCVIYYSITPKDWHLILWPFLYLFVAFLLFSRMYIFHSKNVLDVQYLALKPDLRLDIICYIYIGSALIYLLMMGIDPSLFSLSATQQNAIDAYAQNHEEVEGPVYSNQLQRFVMLYHGYFRIVALICAFTYFCQNRLKLAYLLSISVILPAFVEAMAKASRGTIIELLILVFSCYLVFHKCMPVRTRKSLIRVSIITVFIISLFVFAISLARFEDSDEGVGGSFISYLGHSMLTFDYGLCDTVNGMFYGMRTFKTSLLKLGVGIPAAFNSDLLLGTHFGSGFTTFIGMLVLDFGFWGTLIVGLIFPWLIKKLCNPSGKVTIAGLFFYIFFLNRLIMGVFVNPSGIDFIYYFHLIVYIVLLVFFKGGKKHNPSYPKTNTYGSISNNC